MTENITYNTELEQLLKENSEECESLSILHRMSYEKYNKRSNYINIPVIILSSAIGFITGIDLQYDKMNIICISYIIYLYLHLYYDVRKYYRNHIQ